MLNDFYMLNQLDQYITGDYGEDRDDGWLDKPEEDEGEEDGRRTFGI